MGRYEDILSLIQQTEDLFDKGHRVVRVKTIDGREIRKRLFMAGAHICTFKGRSTTRGYEITPTLAGNWAKVFPGDVAENAIYDHFVKSLWRHKRAFSKDLHPNLWENKRRTYDAFDVPALLQYIEDQHVDKNSLWSLRDAMHKFAAENNLQDLIYETCKRINVCSYVPERHANGYQYHMYLENIERHLECREQFDYAWRSLYDVSISGSTGKDGIYRAWMSLEYRGKGNGHYYLLINPKSAVFSEDD